MPRDSEHARGAPTNVCQQWLGLGPRVLVLALLMAGPAAAQLTDSPLRVPYFRGIEDLYAGEFRDAGRNFQREANGGIKIGTTRWIDSICFYAMLGEVYYQQGRAAPALAEFDRACQLFLQYPNWLTRVRFQNALQVDSNSARRRPVPWGRPERQITLADFPTTSTVFIGRMQNVEELQQQQVTVVEMPQFWKINVAEVVRCTALAIRRRHEILGPLARHDQLSKDLVRVLGVGGNAEPNHWSNAWVELQLGLAHMGQGDLIEAQTHLSRAVIVEGRFDHPLTCVALLAQGQIALGAGDFATASRLFAEASYSAFYYENYNVVREALMWGHLGHVISGGTGPYPPLEAAATWARSRRLDLLTTDFRIAQAEGLALARQTQAAEALLQSTRRLGEMATTSTGAHHLYLQALVRYQQQRIAQGDEALREAVAAQSRVSHRLFQIELTNRLYDGASGQAISARTAMDVYFQLLQDPTPLDWAGRPLDSIALLVARNEAAFDRWFRATLDKRPAEFERAVEVAEIDKRRRFQAACPLGGRLVALRHLLESPQDELSRDMLLLREQVLSAYPPYAALSAEAAELRRQMADGPLLPDRRDDAEQATRYTRWSKNTAEREAWLREIAIRRHAVPMWPPLQSTADLQAGLEPGNALILFHHAAGNLYGVLLTRGDHHVWKLGTPGELHKPLAELLQAMGNHGRNHTLDLQQLTDTSWQAPAAAVYSAIFGQSRLDVASTQRLVIVPDHLLWYVPFEALVLSDGEEGRLLSDSVLLRHAPTAGLAMSPRPPLRRRRHTGIVVEKSAPDRAVARLEQAVTGPTLLAAPLSEQPHLVGSLLDDLVILDEIEPDGSQPFAWNVLPRGRGRTGNSLADWMALPQGGPDQIVLANFATEAENGLRGGRGRSNKASAGSEIFQSLCGLMSAGARTILVSRWRTGGASQYELVGEFAQELPHLPADEAWQRSVLLARDAPLDLAAEPRVARTDVTGDLPTANHPFFWAGYLLVDTHRATEQVENKPPDEPPADGS